MINRRLGLGERAQAVGIVVVGPGPRQAAGSTQHRTAVAA
jgi:hypothetical protein